MLPLSIVRMLAHLQKLLSLTLLGGPVVWAAVCVARGEWAKATWPALGVAGIYGLVLALELVTMRWVHRSDPAPRARWGQLLGAWAGEVLSGPRVFCWQQPFRSQALPDHLPSGAVRGVVLVHGFVCNRGFWNRWLERLRQRGTPFVALNLQPMLGAIERYVPIIEAAVQRLEAATGQAPVIVAHSMGGLAVRAWLAGQTDAARVHRVITLASPHHGTWLARFGISPNTRQMRRGSVFLQGLRARESAQTYAHFTCFFSHCDNVVFPASTATLPGAENRHLPGVAHVQMADHPRVYAELLRWLDTPRRAR